MRDVPIPLDRIRLGRHTFAPRASVLTVRDGTTPDGRPAAWFVSVHAESLPADLVPGRRAISFCGETAAGAEYGGEAEIVSRRDDAYGTHLLLAGLRPMAEPVRS